MNSVAGDAFDLRYFDEREVVRRTAMVPEVVVPRRNEDLANQHRQNLTDPEPNFANDLRPEALLEFPEDLGLRDLFELVVQGRLQNPKALKEEMDRLSQAQTQNQLQKLQHDLEILEREKSKVGQAIERLQTEQRKVEAEANKSEEKE